MSVYRTIGPLVRSYRSVPILGEEPNKLFGHNAVIQSYLELSFTCLTAEEIRCVFDDI